MNTAIVEPATNAGVNADVAEAMFVAEHAQQHSPELTKMLHDAAEYQDMLGPEGLDELEREIAHERELERLREGGGI